MTRFSSSSIYLSSRPRHHLSSLCCCGTVNKLEENENYYLKRVACLVIVASDLFQISETVVITGVNIYV